MEQLEFIDHLEQVRHLYRAERYRLLIAESVAIFFYSRTSNLSKITKETNKVLNKYNIKPISYGFVRRTLDR